MKFFFDRNMPPQLARFAVALCPVPRRDVDKPAHGFALKAELIVVFRGAKGDNRLSLLTSAASRNMSQLNVVWSPGKNSATSKGARMFDVLEREHTARSYVRAVQESKSSASMLKLRSQSTFIAVPHSNKPLVPVAS